MSIPHFGRETHRRILVVAGTRPEAIKLCPVVRELRAREDVECIVASTGQHKELLRQAFQDFDVAPDIEIAVMEPDQTLAGLTSKLLLGIDRVLDDLAPDQVIVQGDTTTALSAALAAFYRRIPVAHVEAGLRTYDKWAPFPEELNRQCISRLADLHFANTQEAVENLEQEGIDHDSIVLTGSTSIDAIQWMRAEIRAGRRSLNNLPELPDGAPVILVTCHRRESFGDRMQNVWLAILDLLDSMENLVVVFPVHPNPNVRGPVNEILGRHPRVILVDPVPYPEMVALIDRSDIVLSDSGGLQEEVPGLGMPLLVLREATERPEAVASGGAILVGTDRHRIAAECRRLLRDPMTPRHFASVINPFGDGMAAGRIADALRTRAAAMASAVG